MPITFDKKIEAIESRKVFNQNICNGKPTTKRTRIAVQIVIEYIIAGDSIGDVLLVLPNLT